MTGRQLVGLLTDALENVQAAYLRQLQVQQYHGRQQLDFAAGVLARRKQVVQRLFAVPDCGKSLQILASSNAIRVSSASSGLSSTSSMLQSITHQPPPT